MMRELAAASAMLVSACGGSEAPQVARDTRVMSWESMASGTGAALILRGQDGGEMLRVACVRDPAQMSVDVANFTDVGGAQALSLNVGEGAPFVFATSVEGGESGIHGEGPIPGDLFDRLGRAETISASYGAQYFGPYAPPERQRVMEFTNACRQIAELQSAP